MNNTLLEKNTVSVKASMLTLPDAKLIQHLKKNLPHDPTSESIDKLVNAMSDRFTQDDSHCVAAWALIELARRIRLQRVNQHPSFNHPNQVIEHLKAELSFQDREVFWVLFLNNQNQLISSEALFQGTINSANVYPREIVYRALSLNAAAIILAHNHPSGIAEPSISDRKITNKINETVSLFDIRVLDHFVIGSNDVISFAQRGWI